MGKITLTGAKLTLKWTNRVVKIDGENVPELEGTIEKDGETENIRVFIKKIEDMEVPRIE